MEDPVGYTIEKLENYFLVQSTERKSSTLSSLIRMHTVGSTGGQRNSGDISFPTDKEIWQNFANQHSAACGKLRLEAFELFDEEEIKDGDKNNCDGAMATTGTCAKINEFLDSTATWLYPVARLEIHHDRCALYLQRRIVVSHILQQVLNEPVATGVLSYGYLRKDPKRCLYLRQDNETLNVEDDNDLSLYRADLIRQAVREVLEYSKWSLVDEDASTINIHVQSVATKCYKPTAIAANNRNVTIRCGIVCDPTTGKLAKIETREYLDLRSNDMFLMATHKYGIRDRRFNDLMCKLGTAAVTVDLLEVKHSSPVQIIRNGQGSTRGASFILYNSARMETLLRTFNERVENSTYANLPDFEDIDVSLLSEEEEWQLVFGYIFQFPNLIERCVEQLESGVCGIHLIVRYLSGLVTTFSIYYRRIRILTDARAHLMPYVYARIYLLKAVREILNKCLALLGIEPVKFM